MQDEAANGCNFRAAVHVFGKSASTDGRSDLGGNAGTWDFCWCIGYVADHSHPLSQFIGDCHAGYSTRFEFK